VLFSPSTSAARASSSGAPTRRPPSSRSRTERRATSAIHTVRTGPRSVEPQTSIALVHSHPRARPRARAMHCACGPFAQRRSACFCPTARCATFPFWPTRPCRGRWTRPRGPPSSRAWAPVSCPWPGTPTRRRAAPDSSPRSGGFVTALRKAASAKRPSHAQPVFVANETIAIITSHYDLGEVSRPRSRWGGMLRASHLAARVVVDLCRALGLSIRSV
jgi:hypothetical protein